MSKLQHALDVELLEFALSVQQFIDNGWRLQSIDYDNSAWDYISTISAVHNNDNESRRFTTEGIQLWLQEYTT